MSRPLRIGLLAEGEAELGRSVPYLTPQDGGKEIDPSDEGALHALIRRELEEIGISDCVFVNRHPSTKERRKGQVRVGHSILAPKYLSQAVIAWDYSEVDLVVIVVDADDELDNRQIALQKALKTIRENHLDSDENPISDQSAGGLAIKSLEAWLLSDVSAVETLLQVTLSDEMPDSLEDLPADSGEPLYAKNLLDNAINGSFYHEDLTPNQRELYIRWELGKRADLSLIKSRCPIGYNTFIANLTEASRITIRRVAPEE